MDSSRLARKRLKPTVSLAAVHRKPKDENQPPKDDGNEQGKASNGSETSASVVELTDVKCPAEESLPQDGAKTVTTNSLESSKPSPRVAPFRSRFIRPKPRLDLVQRPASKQQPAEAEEERTNSVKSVGDEPCKSVAAPLQNTLQEDVDPNNDGQVSITATSPPKSRHDTNSEDAGPVRGKTDGKDLSPVYETKPPARRRCRRWRLEQIRKNLRGKIENGKANRNQLTMFDLIYYNPTSNPMKHPEKCAGIQPGPDESVSSLNEERLEEERADEPSVGAEVEEEDVAMPVPQVKVGPDGQIIIDEQSLVIETTGTQKSREDLQNSSVVMDYGNGSTTYNAYSKKTKMKTREWSKEDTLKFYRALQNIGTDFLLMQTFFPKLTRKEIKAKFKKEERINKELVDKALQNPLKFDISELQREFAKMEEEEEEKKKQPIVKPKSTRKSRGDTFFKSLDETEKKKRGRRPGRPKKPVEKPEESEFVSDTPYQWNYDDLVLGAGAEKDSHPKAKKAKVSDERAGAEVSPKEGTQKQPTRSGRIPQPKVMEDFTNLPDEDEEEEETVRPEKSPVQPEKPPVVAPVVKVRGPRQYVRGGARAVRRPRRTAPTVPVSAPTRSGRVPVRKVFEDYVVDEESQDSPAEVEVVRETEKEKELVPRGEGDEVILEVDADVMEESVVLSTETSDFTHTLGNLGSLYSNVPPGAVVVLATESPDNPGQQVYKVFMVSGNDRVLPVSLDADGAGGDGEFLLTDTQLQQ